MPVERDPCNPDSPYPVSDLILYVSAEVRSVFGAEYRRAQSGDTTWRAREAGFYGADEVRQEGRSSVRLPTAVYDGTDGVALAP